jgi:hypothetical protein
MAQDTRGPSFDKVFHGPKLKLSRAMAALLLVVKTSLAATGLPFGVSQGSAGACGTR